MKRKILTSLFYLAIILSGCSTESSNESSNNKLEQSSKLETIYREFHIGSFEELEHYMNHYDVNDNVKNQIITDIERDTHISFKTLVRDKTKGARALIYLSPNICYEVGDALSKAIEKYYEYYNEKVEISVGFSFIDNY